MSHQENKYLNPISGEFEQLAETTVESELVYEGGFLQVKRDLVRLPDGKESYREYIVHPGAVVIIPLLDDGRVLVERQFRYPIGKVVVEFPAGKVDKGEDLLACAQRELKEETGYTAAQWEYLCQMHNALGYSDEVLTLYLARELSAGEQALDEGEFLETFAVEIGDLLEWVDKGVVTDVKTIVGAFWLAKRQGVAGSFT